MSCCSVLNRGPFVKLLSITREPSGASSVARVDMGVLTPQHPPERLIDGNERGHVGWIGCVVIVFIGQPEAEWCLVGLGKVSRELNR